MKAYVDHYRGARKQDRTTPRDFFAKLHARFNFTLDGAANKSNALLPRYATQDQMRMSWSCERVFCNPPWSDIAPFVELAATAVIAVLLVPARTNCKWFHRALELGARPEFWRGKLSFDGPWKSPVDCLLLIFENSKPTPVRQEKEK